MYELDYKNEYIKAYELIDQYENIVIFRHQRPDGDALGSQLGLATWIKDSFPTKTVYCVGKNTVIHDETVFPRMDEIEDSFFEKGVLGIVVDTADTKRIDDERFKLCKELIKFDHHPNVEPYAKINIVENEIAACGELMYDFCKFFSKTKPLSRLACKYFLTAIITDTGRFQFPSVSPYTFQVASEITALGINAAHDIYDNLYLKDKKSLIFQRYVLNNMKFTDKGVAYYVLTQKDLDEIGISNEEGKEHLSIMSGLKGIHIWFCVTEIQEKNEWRVSLRSKKIDVSKVATKYHGGGHINASGATIYSLSELEPLIKDLEDLI